MHKTRTVWSMALLAVLSIALVATLGMGCDDDDDDGPNGPDPRGDNEVTMQDLNFSPDTLSVASGTEVTWTNDDAVVHTVRSGDPGAPTDLLNSGNIPTGQTYTFTFTNDDDIPDTIDYFCEIHPEMRGVIIVE